jgi:transcriptional regulator with XRE-family HTH domain
MSRDTMNANLVNLVFGFKIKQARNEAGLSLSEFAEQSEISPSYVTEIEKGNKYPRSDKILKMAQVLGKDYDELVSIKLDPSLKYLETALSSPLVHQFPFEEFGMDLSDLIKPFTRAPALTSAFLRSILDIGRQYDMKKDDFLLAALRSYQEIHENYFQDLEDAAIEFAAQHKLDREIQVDLCDLTKVLQTEYGYQLDETRLANHESLSVYRSIYLAGKQPKLLLNPTLQPRQIKFLIARELGYKALNITERSVTSRPNQISSFQQILDDFRASYFGGALLMPKNPILSDLQNFFARTTWEGQLLQDMLIRFDVTPEMLLYRFSELIPEHFGLKLHFLRFQYKGDSYRLVKQLHLNNLLQPSGVGLHEHLCRRWLSGFLLRDLAVSDTPEFHAETPLVGAQKSEFLESQEIFLCFGFARPLVLQMDMGSSVIIGFHITPQLSKTIRFAEDDDIPHIIINETCERCPISADQCTERSAPPTILLQKREDSDRKADLQKLLAEQ